MTTANLTAPSLEQLAPNLTARVKQGDLATTQMGLLGVGVALIGGAWALCDHFHFAYLVGYMGVLGIALCALFFTMIQHITRAGWSVTVRRLAENIAWTLPFLLLLFVPNIVGFNELYHHWTHAVIVEGQPNYDAVIAGKSAWLNSQFFFVRVAIYFVVWILLAWFFRSTSIKQDESGDPQLTLKMARVAAPGLLLFAFTVTFAAFDWIMSLDPHWFSTIFGITYFAGGYMAFLAFTILMAQWLGRKGYLREAINTEHYHDLGKFLWAFMVFWTYTNFSQYMLIYYANLPEETHWFAVRSEGGWGAIGVILIVGHFLFPFAFGLSRHVKRNPITLAFFSVFLLVIHCIDMQFLIMPGNVGHGHAATPPATGAAHDGMLAQFSHQFGEYLHNVSWADYGCFAGLILIVAGLTIMNIRRTNLVPIRDPRLAESIHFQNF